MNVVSLYEVYEWPSRVGSDAPPQMRQTTKRLLIDDADLVSTITDGNKSLHIQRLPTQNVRK